MQLPRRAAGAMSALASPALTTGRSVAPTARWHVGDPHQGLGGFRALPAQDAGGPSGSYPSDWTPPDFAWRAARSQDLAGACTALLEEQVGANLTALLEQQRLLNELARNQAAFEAESAVVRSRRACAEAETDFLRTASAATGSASPPHWSNHRGSAAAFRGTQAGELRALIEAASVSEGSLHFASPVPGLVQGILDQLDRMLCADGAADDVSMAATMRAVRGMADLLVEVDQDFQATASSLARNDICGAYSTAHGGRGIVRPAEAAAALGQHITASASAAPGDALPRPESVVRQLQAENELLREALGLTTGRPQGHLV